MHILVPHYIMERHTAGETRGTFQSASMFVDLSGFSTMADELSRHGHYGAEALADMMRGVFEPLVNAVYEQGGFVIGYAGDAFTAVFPVGQDAGLSVMRCLSAALKMQDHVRSHPRLESDFGAFPISIKTGIGFGETRWQIFKSKDGAHATFWFRGDSLAGAVHAEEQTAPGNILLHSPAYQLIPDQVDAAPSADQCFQVSHLRQDSLSALPLSDIQAGTAFMKIFFPELILQLPTAGEFRHVVNLFVDIPIDITDEALIAPFMETVYALQEKFGGYFLRPDLGDKGFNLLMFWGAPATHENDVQRALNFLLELSERTRLNLRAGISYRVAYAGFMGSGLREDYTCYGWGVNLAARLMEHAHAGNFWLDEETAQRAEKHFHVEYLADYKFKGFAQLQKTFVLRGRKELVETVFHGRFLGRTKELELLASFIDPLQAGRFAGVMVIGGDAGMGKSRLVNTFQVSDYFRQFNVQWAVCQTNEILRSSYNPFLDWLKRKFDFHEGQSDLVNWQHFMRNLDLLLEKTRDEETVRALKRTSSVLAALLNIKIPDSLYEQLNARDRYENTRIALSAFLRAESLQKPLILFVEDTHWLDEDSGSFLSYFTRTLLANPEKQYPIAILATQRLEGDSVQMMDDVAMSEIRLEKLSPGNLSTLAEEILGKPLADSFVALLDERADGNPFFAEQIVRYLQENNALILEDGIYHADASALDSLPADVQAIMVARLDQLTQHVRDTVQTAAVLGREFELRLLAQMVQNVELHQNVKSAEQANIWAPLSELAYFFRHALLRDAAYSMQLASRQRELHSLAVHAMEVLYKNDLEPYYGELAYHSERANLDDKALHYLRLAAESASMNYQNAQAEDYYTRILALIPEDDLRTRFDILYKRVEMYDRMGKRVLQDQDLARLEEIAVRLDDIMMQGRVWMKRAYFYTTIADYPNVILYSERALETALPVMDHETILKTYIVLPQAFLRTGNLDEAMKRGLDALDFSREVGDQTVEASALTMLGLIALEKMGPSAAFDYHKQALVLAQGTGDRYLEAKVLNNIANAVGLSQGDYASALEYFEQSLVINQELGNLLGQCTALANLGWVSSALGDYDAAQDYYHKALTLAREVDARSDEAYTLINLSAAAVGRGNPTIALAWAEKAFDLSQKLGDTTADGWAYFYMGHAHLLSKNYRPAREAFQESIRIREEINVPVLVAEARAGLAEAALAMQDFEMAFAETEKVLTYLEQNRNLEGAEEPLRVCYECHLVLREKGDARSNMTLERAHELLRHQVSKLPPGEARRMFVENVPWRRAIEQAWLAVNEKQDDDVRC
jgi:predicted ATPase/class 3 adenylate cyclase